MRPTLLLLPGMLCDHVFWRAQCEALADLCTPCVVSYGLADSIDKMAERVLSAGPASFALAGHSMGGRVALEVVKRAPERVERLGLFCTDYRGHESEAARTVEAMSRERLLANARESGMANLARRWFVSQIAAAQAANAELIRTMTAMGARHSLQQLEAEFSAGLNRQDYAHLLAAISCPTLVCAAELDWLRPVGGHIQMAARIPHARLIVIEGSGHMVAMERPDALTAAMRDWLTAAERDPTDRHDEPLKDDACH